MKMGIAILGVGRWGGHFVRQFNRHPQSRVVAVVDPCEANLQRCQQACDLDRDRVTFATDWQAVRTLDSIDAVVVVTPASTHYDLIADALGLGYHVLSEKPLTLSAARCLELTRLAERCGRLLFVDHTYLFHPAVRAGLATLQSGSLGELRYGYASRVHLSPVRQDVDALWDLAIHDIAIFNHWLGQEPVSAQAIASVWLQSDRCSETSDRPGLADLVWSRLVYPNGFQATLHHCWLNPDKQRRLAIAGSRGSLVFDELSTESPLTFYRGELVEEGDRFVPIDRGRECVAVANEEPLQQVCDRFLSLLRDPQPCARSSGWTAAKLVNILEALSESLERNGAIVPIRPLDA